MGLRFRRSIKLAPGLRVNLSRSGVSLSAGVRGASVTVGKRGTYANVGLPGSGISYRKRLDKRSASPTVIKDKLVQCLIDDNLQLKFFDEVGEPLPERLIKQAKKYNRAELIEGLKQECDKKNQPMEAILNLHLDTPMPGKPMDWTDVYPAFPDEEPGVPEYETIGWLDYLLFWQYRQKSLNNQTMKSSFEASLEQWQQNRAQYEEECRKDWSLRYETPEQTEAFLEKVIAGLEWPEETQVSFSLSDDGKTCWLDTDLPEIEDLPTDTFRVVERGLKLGSTTLSATQQRKNYMNHIHAIGFRLIGEVFRAIPVDRVVFSGYSQRVSPATAHVEDQYLYSVKVQRSQWQQLNFSNLEALSLTEVMETFELKRNMTKTGIFRGIEPFMETAA